MHALIIDDDANNLEVLGKLLAKEQLTYTAVQNPTLIDSALESLSRVDVIFLDLEMPKIDGYEMLQHLRERLGTQIPIIACTVHTTEINTARRLGFHSFIAKPLKIDKFPDQLHRVLNGEAVWDMK